MYARGRDRDVSAYRLDGEPAPDGVARGTSTHAGVACFLECAEQGGVWPTLAARGRLPGQERRSDFTHLPTSQALITALAANCRCARDSDCTVAPDPLAGAALGRPRGPHCSHLAR